MSFEKILIANRGEIARRVMATCRDYGLLTVAVYSDADADAPHVAEADEAVRLGPAPAAESYLNVEAILAAAKATGAGAIHPGYGFLAENADFAAAVEGAGLIFVGPTAETIRAMGDKAAARRLMAARGVPVAPGYAGDDQSVERFVEEAAGIGYPLLVKAAAGGGGKGMRIVRDAAELPAAVDEARRLAQSGFGDPTLILEKYIERPRHIEVQIVGDGARVIHCFERECSVQRRFQKIIEEAPSPAVDEAMREELCAAALTAGEALGYRGAGTVEFIAAADGAFYFLEINTRLQVEHPVTERITGLDLVALQLDVALGGAVPPQSSITRTGHAIECRIYAEDAANGFLPSTGAVVDWRAPEMAGVRVDAGVERGSDVGIHYDPMLAKVIADGPDRAQATRRMIGALRRLSVMGPTTNRDFLLAVLRHPAWGAGDLSTHFIADHLADWQPTADPAARRRRLIAAALADATQRAGARRLMPGIRAGWTNNTGDQLPDTWSVDGVEHRLSYRALGGGRFVVDVDGAGEQLTAQVDGERIRLTTADGVTRRLTVIADGPRRWVGDLDGTSLCIEAPRFPDAAADEVAGGAVAPMPGKIVRVCVAVGDTVAKGAPLVILEAMKMEQTLTAPAAGTVVAIRAEAGAVVDAGAVLVELDGEEAEA